MPTSATMEELARESKFAHLYAQYGQLVAQSSTAAANAIRTQIIDEDDAQHWRAPAISKSERKESLSVAVRLRARQLTGKSLRASTTISGQFVADNTEFNKRILGHLMQTFCVVFDRSGEYVLTGSDDFLVKAWEVRTCRLRYTYRGCNTQITDLNVSYDNTLIAASSFDKHIRVWSLQDGRPIAVVPAHHGMTSCIHFLPTHTPNTRHLLSLGNDGAVIFTAVKNDSWSTMEQTRFNERQGAPPVKMLASVHSPGGRIVTVGGSDGRLRIYVLDGEQPRRVFEQQVHTDIVDSLAWASDTCPTLTFATASRDGTAKVWTLDHNQWKHVAIDVSRHGKRHGMIAELERGGLPTLTGGKKEEVLHVDMVAFAHKDDWLCASLDDANIYVCSTKNGHLVKVLAGLTASSYVLNTHPINDSLLMSASYDGRVSIWDTTTGNIIFQHYIRIPGEGHANAFDAQFSPDGTSMAAVDSNGCLLLFGTCKRSNTYASMTPDQQFFHTDFRPLSHDAQGYVLDQQTEQAPHLMAPPTLVDMHGHPHDDHCQQFVPGRELEHATTSHAPVYMGANAQQGTAAIEQALIHHIEMHQDAERDVTPPAPNAVDATAVALNVSVWAMPGRFIVHPLAEDQLRGENAVAVARGARELNECYACSEAPPEHSQSPSPPPVRRRRTAEEREAIHVQRIAAPRLNHNPQERRERANRRRANAGHDDDDVVDVDHAVAQHDDEMDIIPGFRDQSGSGDEGLSTDDGDGSSSSDTSDTDYDIGESRPRAVTGERRRRAPTQRRAASSPHDDDVEDEEHDEELAIQQPSTSSRGRQRKRAFIASRVMVFAARQRATTIDSDAVDDAEVAAMPEWQKSFPRWVTMREPRFLPYSPQVHDEIVVIRAAYIALLNHVKETKLFKVKQSWWPNADFREEERARVDRIQYVMKPYRAAKLHLSQLNHLTNAPTGITYSILYADLDHQADFILLAHHFDEAMRHDFAQGERVVSLLDEQWYTGRVVNNLRHTAGTSSTAQRATTTCFSSVCVSWDNEEGSEDHYSPWDLRPDDGTLLARRGPAVRQATREHHTQMANYVPTTTDFPTEQGITTQRILAAVTECIDDERFGCFSEDVPLDVYPTYSAIVPYAMHLNTIKERLTNGFYRRVAAIEQDVGTMLTNALLFNEENSAVVNNARVLVETLLRYISCESLAVTLSETLETVLDVPVDEMNKCEDLLAADREMRAMQITGASAVHVSTTQWRADCAHILDDTMKTAMAKPFITDGTHPAIFEADADLLSLNEIAAKLRQRVDSYASPMDVKEDVERLTNAGRQLADNRRDPLHTLSHKLSAALGAQLDRVQVEVDERNKAGTNDNSRKTTVDATRTSRHGRPLRQRRPVDAYDEDVDDERPRRRRRAIAHRRTEGSETSEAPVVSRTGRPQRQRRAVVHFAPDDDDEDEDDHHVSVVDQRRSREKRARRRLDSPPNAHDEPPKRRKRVARVLSDDDDEEERRTLRTRNRTTRYAE